MIDNSLFLALNDSLFLDELNYYPHKEKYVKIISLDFSENPIEEITGIVTSGSLNIDGKSSKRRSCTLSLVT
jgi:hypothetical protein